MSRKTFLQLLDAYGNAQFDCGAWETGSLPYETLVARAAEARQELCDALRKAGLPITAAI